ncbi:MAG: flagellar hook-length control protein FliK [Lachnospiraceae bacterium]
MDKISVKSADMNLRASDSTKASGRASEVTDDFRKLLTGQQSDSQEVSKDTKTENKQEPVKETKEEPAKDEKKEPVKDEAPVKDAEEKSQTAGLLAAYQMSQNMRPEVITVTPEVTEEDVPDTETFPEVQTELQMPVNTAEENVMPAETQPAVIQKAAEDMKAGEVKADSEKPVEVIQTEAKQETAPVQKKADDTGKEDAPQTDSRQAEQTSQPAQTQPEPVRTPVQETRLQEPVRMQVPQPEELPQKVTDQLMAKMTEGVREFEIQIEPANLGKIAVKILYQDGQATVSIMCSEKKTFEMLGRNAGEIGQVIEKNLGGTTTIIVDKQENDYLNQTRDENQKNGQNQEQEQKEGKKNQDAEDAQQFLQKLRLGLMN